MQNAINAMTNTQFIFVWLKMDISRSAFMRLPDNLVHKFDDTGFLIPFSYFLVADEQLHVIIFSHLTLRQFVNRLGTYSVIFLIGTPNLLTCGQHKPYRYTCCKTHRPQQAWRKRVAHCCFKHSLLNLQRNDLVLHCDL